MVVYASLLCGYPPRHRHCERSPAEPGFLRGCAWVTAGEAHGELRRSNDLPLLLWRRGWVSGDDCYILSLADGTAGSPGSRPGYSNLVRDRSRLCGLLA